MIKAPFLLFIIALMLFSSENVFAVEKMDGNTAHALGKIALIGTHNESGALERDDRNPADSAENGFYVMQGWSEHGTFGWFAVNAWTGDVWDIGGGNCIHLSNPYLRKEQEKIKSKFDDKREYARLSRLKPRRMSDLEFCGAPP